MEELKQQPFRRDYLVEAIKIAEGGAFKAIRREHLKALYDAYIGTCQRHDALRRQLQSVIKQALNMKSLRDAAQVKAAPAPAKPNTDNRIPEQEKTDGQSS
jgi:hypothetical protein